MLRRLSPVRLRTSPASGLDSPLVLASSSLNGWGAGKQCCRLSASALTPFSFKAPPSGGLLQQPWSLLPGQVVHRPTCPSPTSHALLTFHPTCSACGTSGVACARLRPSSVSSSQKTAELPAAQSSAGANRLAGWLEQVAASNKVDALVATLQRLPWVLARKGDGFAFKQSHEVIDHPGAEVLRHEFWVVAGKIPASLTGLIQTNRLQGTRTVLEAIGRSLSSSASAAPAAARAVYELLTELTSDETATDTWREIATSAPVYRLFRTTGRDPDRLVADEELFLGDQDAEERLWGRSGLFWPRRRPAQYSIALSQTGRPLPSHAGAACGRSRADSDGVPGARRLCGACRCADTVRASRSPGRRGSRRVERKGS